MLPAPTYIRHPCSIHIVCATFSHAFHVPCRRYRAVHIRGAHRSCPAWLPLPQCGTALQATARVSCSPAWATTHLHRTSAFLKVAEERLNGSSGSGRMRGMRVPCTSEPLLPRRSASASAGHPTVIMDRSAFAACSAGAGYHFHPDDVRAALPGIHISAAHSHVEPDDSGAAGGYGSTGHPSMSPLAAAHSNPLSVGSGTFARTISQPSFPHASCSGTSAPVGVASPHPAAAEAGGGGLSSRSQAAYRGTSSFMEYCHTSHTSVADEMSDDDDSNCALLPHLGGDHSRSNACHFSHAAHVPQGKIPLRLPPPPPRRHPRYKVGSALAHVAPRCASGVRGLPPYRPPDSRRDDVDGGYDSAASDGLLVSGTPPLPPARSRRVQRSTSARMRTSSSHSGMRGGSSGTLMAAHACRRAPGARRMSDHLASAGFAPPRYGGAVSDSGCLGLSAPTGLACEDPLAPWAGDPASVVAGPSTMSLEEYVGSTSAFYTSDGTGFSGDLRDSISFGTVR